MKALMLHGPDEPFKLEDVPDPKPEAGEAVAKVLACGSGLTIQHYKKGRSKADYPLIIGHEITGEIAEVGAGVKNVKVGHPVTAYYYLICGYCSNCISQLEPHCENLKGNVGKNCDGGYAEYIKLPSHLFIPLPEGASYKENPAEWGVITDALATPYKVVHRAAIKPGEYVAVFGGGGGLGIHQLMMAKWAGAQVIAVDTDASKFDACEKAGADFCVDASKENVIEALKDISHGGIDVAVDYVSAQVSLEQGLGALGKRGRMVTLGGSGEKFGADAMHLLFNELNVMGSKYVSRQQVVETLDLVAAGEVWPLVSEKRPLKEAEELHELVEQGKVTGRAALIID